MYLLTKFCSNLWSTTLVLHNVELLPCGRLKTSLSATPNEREMDFFFPVSSTIAGGDLTLALYDGNIYNYMLGLAK